MRTIVDIFHGSGREEFTFESFKLELQKMDHHFDDEAFTRLVMELPILRTNFDSGKRISLVEDPDSVLGNFQPERQEHTEERVKQFILRMLEENSNSMRRSTLIAGICANYHCSWTVVSRVLRDPSSFRQTGTGSDVMVSAVLEKPDDSFDVLDWHVFSLDGASDVTAQSK